MLIVTKFDIGDTVKVGPHTNAKVLKIFISATVTYMVGYWVDDSPNEYIAYDWELTLVEKVEANHE